MLEILNMVAKGKAAGGNFHSFGAITLGPNTYANEIFTFPRSGRAYYTAPGVPAGMTIRANTDFRIEMDVKTNLANTYQMLFGDLVDNSGTGTYWVTINNTYQASSMLAFECLGAGLGVMYTKRFRFGLGTAKFPHGVVKRLVIKRVSGVITASLDGVAFPESYTDNSGFAPVSNTPFAIGGSSDNRYLFSGTIGNVHLRF